MAKRSPKSDQLILDDFNFDGEFDFEEFSFEVKPPKNNREVVTRVASSAAKEAINQIRNPSFFRGLVRKSLPRGYGDVLDLADTTVGTVKELYNEGADIVRPALNDLARITDKLLPQGEKYLPKPVLDLMKKFVEKNKPQQQFTQRTQDDFTNNAVAQMLAETFKYNATTEAKRSARENVKDELRETIKHQQHTESVDQLDGIRRSVTQMANYQSRIEFGFHRKSLELQMRHYFVAVDLFNETKRQNAIVHEHLQGIMQNTALPDIVKASTSETLKAMAKRKIFDSLSNTVFGNRDGYVGRLKQAFKDQAFGSLQSLTSGLRSGIFGAETVADAAAAGSGIPGQDKYTTAGTLAGTWLANRASNMFGRFAGNRVGNGTGKVAQGIRRVGNKLEHAVENAPQKLNDFASRSTTAGDYTSNALSNVDWISEPWKRRIAGAAGFIGDPLLDQARGTIKRANAKDNTVVQESAERLAEPAVWSNKSARSLNEIIPGYLARILQEQQIMRTGDSSIDLVQFDHSKGGFTTTKKLRQSIFGSLVSKQSVDAVGAERNTLIDQIDPEGKLSKQQRRILADRLMSDNLGNRAGYEAGNIDNYTSGFAFQNSPHEKKHAETFANLFKELSKKNKDSDFAENTKFGTNFGRLGRAMNDNRQQIQELLSMYPRSVLEDMGIFKQDANGNYTSEINMERLQAFYAGEDYNANADTAEGGVNPNRPALNNRRARKQQRRQQVRDAQAAAQPAAPALPQPRIEQSSGMDETNEILKTINETVTKRDYTKPLTDIQEVLLAIQERLDNGILTQAYPEGGLPPNAGPRPAGGPGRIRRGLSRLNFRISDIAKGTWRAGSWFARKAGGLGNSIASNVIGTAWSLTKGVGGLAKDAAFGVAGGAYRRARGFVDIYVGNEKKPRMYGRQLQEGNVYFNKDTGKPIRNIKDITGQVVSRIGGVEKVVLEADEIDDAWQREGAVKKAIKTLGAVAKFGAKIGNGIVSAVLGGIPPVYRAAVWGVKKAWGLLDMAQDIFVKGQTEPALLARLMRAGTYYSAVSGKQITKPSQIDGPVLVGNGDDAETALSHDDIRKGLVDKNGKPIRTGLAKLLSLAFGGISRAAKLAKKAGDMVWSAGKSVVKTGYAAGKAIVKTGVNTAGFVLDRIRGKPWGQGGFDSESGMKTVNWLEKIYGLLDERLVKPKPKDVDDADGDGIRDGSYDDQVKKAKEKADAAQADGNQAQGDKPKGAGLFAGMAAGGRSLWDRIRGKKKNADGEEEDAGDGVNVNIGGEGGAKGGGAPKPKGPGWKDSKGIWGKTKFLAGKGWGGLKTAGSWGLRGGAALLGLEGLGLGGALAAGGGMLASGAAAAASGVAAAGSGLLAAGGAIAGLISAPVLLGAAAVAAVGIGGYYAYKYLTKRRLTALTRVRYTQYGFNPAKDDYVAAVFGLEDKLRAAVVKDKDGSVTLDAGKIKTEDLTKDFGVDQKDEKALNNWLKWFSARFKPVFLTHVTALGKVAPDKWLSEVDSLDGPAQFAYFNTSKFPEGPYNVFTSPFSDLKELPSGKGDVDAMVQLASIEVEKKSKETSKAAEKVAVGAGAAAAVAGVAAVGKDGAADPAKPMAVNAALINKIAGETADTSGMASQGTRTTVSGSIGALGALSANSLDAIDVVRFKTYGLVKMEADKVKMLRSLEAEIEKDLTFKDKVASWSGSMETTLKALGPMFGVDATDDRRAGSWVTWFTMRFLPVYLNYATVIKGATGRDKPSDGKTLLKNNQLVDVATSIYTSSGNSSGAVKSAWSIIASPWGEDYKLNTDVKSVDGNIQGLKEAAKNAVLDEPSAKAKAAAGGAAGAAGTGADKPKQDKGWFGNAVDKTVSFFGGAKSTYTSGMGDAPGTSRDGGGVGSSAGGGRVVDDPGTGTGGSVEGIPMPRGNKSWDALKDTILAAAKMVGVDEKLMAVMAAIESGFNYSAKAGTSTASGLYQFIDGTWKTMIKKYGKKYGLDPNVSQGEPRANALMGAEYIKENVAALSRVLKRPLTDTDIYLAHFLGSGGASKFLTADPSASAAQILPEAARANRSIFYGPQGNPLTVGEVYKLVQNRVQSKGKQFGISIAGGEAMVDSKKPDAGTSAPSSAPSASSPSSAPTGDTPSSTPSTSAPAPSTSLKAPNAIGTPATAPTVKPDAKAPPEQSSVPAPKPASAPTPAPGPQLTGFTPQKINNSQDLADQNRMQADSRKVDMDGTNKILSDTLEVHKKSFNLLERIAKATEAFANKPAEKESKPSNASNDPTPASSQTRVATRGRGDLPPMPVSVAKPNY